MRSKPSTLSLILIYKLLVDIILIFVVPLDVKNKYDHIICYLIINKKKRTKK